MSEMTENTAPEADAGETLNGKPARAPKAKAPNKSPRRRSRELALQGLYQWRIGANDAAAIEAHLQDLDGFNKADRELCFNLIRGVLVQHQRLEQMLTGYIDRNFAELSPIEACILMIGALELLEYPETPYRVIINEAIELAKAFGGTDGHRYVNGVLDKLAASVRPDEFKARLQR